MNERGVELNRIIEKTILDAYSDCYGISGAQKLLIRDAIDTVSDKVRRWEGRNLDIKDVFDVGLELEKYGFEGLSNDNFKVLFKYGEQLIWEGENFGKPDKKRAGTSIIKRILLGKVE